MNTVRLPPLPEAKRPALEYAIHPLLQHRWSPRAFSAQPLSAEAQHILMEAARWAASSSNRQPWRFIWIRREAEEAFARMIGCLSPGNRPWAQNAAALVLSVAAVHPPGQERPNRHAWHDLGMAVAQLSLQATTMGLVLHQMGGFDPAAARTAYKVPAGFEPVAVIAIGHPGAADQLPEPYREREQAPRERAMQATFAYADTWQGRLPFHAGAQAAEVLEFWFGAPGADGLAVPGQAAKWWRADADFDAQVRARFLNVHEAVLAGRHDRWLTGAAGRLAWILVLDQFSRNLFRGTARMYAADAQALQAALEGIDLGMDRCLPMDRRSFYYLPLMHSEQLTHQDRCVALFAAMRDELVDPQPRERVEQGLAFAERHREVVRSWGRFPHRNAVLGRESTPAERDFLQNASHADPTQLPA